MKKIFFIATLLATIGFGSADVNAQADKKLIDKANAGDFTAMRTLAFCYERGAGVPIDSSAALQLYRKAAEKGDGESWLCVSRYYLEGDLMPADTVRYFSIRKEWADKGLPNAIAALGIAYMNGYGVKADSAYALQLILQSVDKGSWWGYSTLGEMYNMGFYTLKADSKKAEQYYKKAMKAGDLTATTDLAYLYANRGDFKSALKYIDESLKYNDPAANSLLAQLYFGGKGVALDERKAQQLISQVADRFYVTSLGYSMAGDMYMYPSDPTLVDSLKAIYYWDKGIANGNAICRFRKAMAFLDANRTDEALRLLNDIVDDKRSDADIAGRSCVAIAKVYSDGEGTEHSEAKALEWLNRGVNQFKSALCAQTLAEMCLNDESLAETGNYSQCMAYYAKAVELGDSSLLADYGRLSYINGDVEGAKKVFTQMIDGGNPDGYYWMAMLYSDMQNENKAMEALLQGDKAGSSVCRQVLGGLYEDGYNGQPDYKKAEKYYLSAATAKAYDQLGKLYLSGSLGKQSPKDYAKGIDYIRKSADMGHVDAIYRLGYFYENGYYVDSVDHKKAVTYFKLLADNGIPGGYFKMGLYHELGDGGIEADSLKAIDYYRRAAEMGHGEAMCYLGDFYRIGRYLPLDKQKAFEYYAAADSVGEELGTYYVGRSYLEGCGVAIDTATAIPYLRAAAYSELGKPAFLLAEFYNEGKGTLPQVEDSATYYYIMAHNNGSGEASYYIGRMLMREGYDKQAVEYLYTGARRGNYDAMTLFALCLQDGTGIEADPEEAYSILENVTRRTDNAMAYYSMGLARLNGQGCQQSETLGKLYLDTAAMLGYSRAMTLLGVCYLNGYGCEPDTAEAIKWYKNAIEAGSLDACNRLGYLYEAQEDYENAVACYQKSVDGGNLEGYCCLGLCYEKGRGVVLSYKKAYELYSVAAENGYGRGYLMLAFCYLEGINVEEDNVVALKWFIKAAEAGNVLGMYNAAALLEEGENGVQRDHKKAKYWYTQAAAAGYEPAIQALANMK